MFVPGADTRVCPYSMFVHIEDRTMNLARVRRGLDEERGIELIEFIGTAPMIIICGLIIWQFMVFAHCAMVTQSAAREGARAAATYENVYGAVRTTMRDFDFMVIPGFCSGAGDMVKVRVRGKVPIIDIPFIPISEIWTDSTGVSRCEEF